MSATDRDDQVFTDLQVFEMADQFKKTHGKSYNYLTPLVLKALVSEVILRVVEFAPDAIRPADVRDLHRRLKLKLGIE